MDAIWQAILALPQGEQAALGSLALIVVAFALRGVFTLFPEKRTQTVYVLDAAGRSESTPARRIGDPRSARNEPERDSSGADEGAGEESDAAEWTEGRSVCPVCGYPTGVNEITQTCVLCDWQEPEPSMAGLEVAPSELREDLAVARKNYAASGSSLSAEDRKTWAGELTPREVELRGQLREKFDLLQDGTPIDEDPWEEIDRISAELQAKDGGKPGA